MAMHKLYVLFAILISTTICGFLSQKVIADDIIDDKKIIFSHIYVGAPSSDDNASLKEFISIYNNSVDDIDISDWCVVNKSGQKFACFIKKTLNENIYLPSHSYATIGSDYFGYETMLDVIYPSPNKSSGALVASNDTLILINKSGEASDVVMWDGLTGGYVMQRQIEPTAVYTGSIDDFQRNSTLVISSSGLQRQSIPDSCINIDGFQFDVPNGLMSDDIGNCFVDVCSNIDGLQQSLPENMKFESISNCVYIDKCLNIEGIQSVVPIEYVSDDYANCRLKFWPLKISEILPNPVGTDDGSEFIEIYNPNDTVVDLINYSILVGIDKISEIKFSESIFIKPGEYVTIYNNQIKFTLVNTSSVVKIQSMDGVLIDEMSAYVSPKDGYSWANINDSWQYTNQLTPNLANLSSFAISDATLNSEAESIEPLKPCAANQYRSPETNRCRSVSTIISASAVLTPCRDGQYRSEETNRCRNITSDVISLIPCGDGQERNPETNRCRSISAVLGDSALKPCDVGEERNSETNRCRKINSGTIPTASYAPEQVKSLENNNILWLSLAGVGSVAIAYGIWEWRTEIVQLFHKIGLFRGKK